MLFLSIAFPLEAKPFIRHFSLQKEEKTFFPLYKNEQIVLGVTGCGQNKAAAAFGYVAALYPIKIAVNIGYAGHAIEKSGALFSINKILGEPSFYPHRRKDFSLDPSTSLQTVEKMEKTFADLCLYDMEAQGFFSAAMSFLPLEKIFLWKIVSDGPNDPFVPTSKWIEKSLEKLAGYINKLTSEMKKEKNEPFLPNLHFSSYQKHRLQRLLSLAEGSDLDFSSIKAPNASTYLDALEKTLRDTLPNYV